MRVTAKIVNETKPTDTEIVGYSEQMQPLATITDYTEDKITIEAASIEALLYAANFLGIRKLILTFIG